MKRLTIFALVGSVSGMWLGCNSRASDAGDFYDKQIENSCYIAKKCNKLSWNEQEYKNIKDCVDDLIDEDYKDIYIENCPDFDEDLANECLSQMIGEYNSCSPAHDYDDGDFDCKDDPCQNICGDCQGGDYDTGYDGPGDPDEEDEDVIY